MQYITIGLAKDTKWNSSTARNFIDALLNKYARNLGESDKALFLDISATHLEIVYQIFVQHEDNADNLNQLIWTYYPDAKIFEFGWLKPSTLPLYSQTAIFYRQNNLDENIPAYTTASILKSKADPLIFLANAMNNLVEGEVITYRVDLAIYRKVEKSLSDIFRGFFKDAIAAERSPYHKTDEQKLRALIDERLKSKIAAVRISIHMFSPYPRRYSILDSAVSTIEPLSTWSIFNRTHRLNSNVIRTNEEYLDIYLNHSGIRVSDTVSKESSFYLTADEIAAFWHLPHEESTASKIFWKEEEPPTSLPEPLRDIEGIYIGESYDQPVRLPTDDRTTHTVIIGKTGTGKTTSMHHMITHDIANGHGVMVIDPTGNLIREILAHSIPDSRIDDVVLLDFGLEIDKVRYPPPLNPLFRVRKQDGTSRLSPDLATVMNRIYGEEFSKAQMGDLLGIVLKIIALEENPILRDIREFLQDDKVEYRKSLLKKSKNSALVEAWEDFEYQFKTLKQQSYLPLMRRLWLFYDDMHAMASTCHPDPLDVPKFVQENKIVLLNVSATNNNLEAEERYILGSMVVSQLFNYALGNKIEGKPFMLYIDEAEQFTTIPLADMLARARQYNIGLVLANQWLGQFASNQQAVENTVGAMMAFELGREDANVIRYYMNTFEAEDLMRLGEYKAAISIRHNKERLNSFLVNTAAPYRRDDDPQKTQARIERIKRASKDNQKLKSYEEVIKWIENRYSNNDYNVPQKLASKIA